MPQRQFRSSITTQGRRMAGARSLWRATGMKTEDFRKPIIAIANSFTQFVPGHVHLHEVGQKVKAIIDANGGYGVEFNTIAVDDGIAMGHDGYLTKNWRRDGNGWKRKARMLSSHAIVSARSPPPCGRMRHSRPVLPAARCEM